MTGTATTQTSRQAQVLRNFVNGEYTDANVPDSETAFDQLSARLQTEAGGADKAAERPVFVRADGRAPYQAVARVMARLSASGFTKLNLITDTAPEA